MQWAKGSKLCEINKIVETDHRFYIIDIDMEGYFNRKLLEWDEINKSILDPCRKSYREKFKEYVEE